LPGNCVEIVATATGSGFETAAPEGVTIRLVPPGVIQPPASSPTAAFTFSPQPASANAAVIFDASATQVGSGASQIVSYNWTFGDGSTSTIQNPSHSYAVAGTYTVAFTVTDNQGATTSVSHTVTVASGNQPPIAGFTSSCSGRTCSFLSTSSDPDGSIAVYSWTFGDGGTSTLQDPAHTYAVGGVTYTVTLTVTDNQGATNTVSQSRHVRRR